MKKDDKQNKNTEDDSTLPKTFRSDACYDRLKDSFEGAIWDNATVYPSKAAARDAADPPDSFDGYSIVAKEGGDEGVLMAELFITIESSCSDGSITGRRLLGKVQI